MANILGSIADVDDENLLPVDQLVNPQPDRDANLLTDNGSSPEEILVADESFEDEIIEGEDLSAENEGLDPEVQKELEAEDEAQGLSSGGSSSDSAPTAETKYDTSSLLGTGKSGATPVGENAYGSTPMVDSFLQQIDRKQIHDREYSSAKQEEISAAVKTLRDSSIGVQDRLNAASTGVQHMRAVTEDTYVGLGFSRPAAAVLAKSEIMSFVSNIIGEDVFKDDVEENPSADLNKALLDSAAAAFSSDGIGDMDKLIQDAPDVALPRIKTMFKALDGLQAKPDLADKFSLYVFEKYDGLDAANPNLARFTADKTGDGGSGPSDEEKEFAAQIADVSDDAVNRGSVASLNNLIGKFNSTVATDSVNGSGLNGVMRWLQDSPNASDARGKLDRTVNPITEYMLLNIDPDSIDPANGLPKDDLSDPLFGRAAALFATNTLLNQTSGVDSITTLEQFREAFMQDLNPIQLDDGSVSLMTGDKQGIAPEVEDFFKRAGIPDTILDKVSRGFTSLINGGTSEDSLAFQKTFSDALAGEPTLATEVTISTDDDTDPNVDVEKLFDQNPEPVRQNASGASAALTNTIADPDQVNGTAASMFERVAKIDEETGDLTLQSPEEIFDTVAVFTEVLGEKVFDIDKTLKNLEAVQDHAVELGMRDEGFFNGVSVGFKNFVATTSAGLNMDKALASYELIDKFAKDGTLPALPSLNIAGPLSDDFTQAAKNQKILENLKQPDREGVVKFAVAAHGEGLSVDATVDHLMGLLEQRGVTGLEDPQAALKTRRDLGRVVRTVQAGTDQSQVYFDRMQELAGSDRQSLRGAFNQELIKRGLAEDGFFSRSKGRVSAVAGEAVGGSAVSMGATLLAVGSISLLSGGTAAVGVGTSVLAGGGSGYISEYAATIAQVADENGVPFDSVEDIRKLISDPEKLADLRRKAHTRGVVIGSAESIATVLDAATGKLGGQVIRQAAQQGATRGVRSLSAGTATTGVLAAESTVGGLTETAGEAVAAFMTDEEFSAAEASNTFWTGAIVSGIFGGTTAPITVYAAGRNDAVNIGPDANSLENGGSGVASDVAAAPTGTQGSVLLLENPVSPVEVERDNVDALLQDPLTSNVNDTGVAPQDVTTSPVEAEQDDLLSSLGAEPPRDIAASSELDVLPVPSISSRYGSESNLDRQQNGADLPGVAVEAALLGQNENAQLPVSEFAKRTAELRQARSNTTAEAPLIAARKRFTALRAPLDQHVQSAQRSIVARLVADVAEKSGTDLSTRQSSSSGKATALEIAKAIQATSVRKATETVLGMYNLGAVGQTQQTDLNLQDDFGEAVDPNPSASGFDAMIGEAVMVGDNVADLLQPGNLNALVAEVQRVFADALENRDPAVAMEQNNVDAVNQYADQLQAVAAEAGILYRNAVTQQNLEADQRNGETTVDNGLISADTDVDSANIDASTVTDTVMAQADPDFSLGGTQTPQAPAALAPQAPARSMSQRLNDTSGLVPPASLVPNANNVSPEQRQYDAAADKAIQELDDAVDLATLEISGLVPDELDAIAQEGVQTIVPEGAEPSVESLQSAAETQALQEARDRASEAGQSGLAEGVDGSIVTPARDAADQNDAAFQNGNVDLTPETPTSVDVAAAEALPTDNAGSTATPLVQPGQFSNAAAQLAEPKGVTAMRDKANEILKLVGAATRVPDSATASNVFEYTMQAFSTALNEGAVHTFALLHTGMKIIEESYLPRVKAVTLRDLGENSNVARTHPALGTSLQFTADQPAGVQESGAIAPEIPGTPADRRASWKAAAKNDVITIGDVTPTGAVALSIVQTFAQKLNMVGKGKKGSVSKVAVLPQSSINAVVERYRAQTDLTSVEMQRGQRSEQAQAVFDQAVTAMSVDFSDMLAAMGVKGEAHLAASAAAMVRLVQSTDVNLSAESRINGAHVRIPLTDKDKSKAVSIVFVDDTRFGGGIGSKNANGVKDVTTRAKARASRNRSFTDGADFSVLDSVTLTETIAHELAHAATTDFVTGLGADDMQGLLMEWAMWDHAVYSNTDARASDPDRRETRRSRSGIGSSQLTTTLNEDRTRFDFTAYNEMFKSGKATVAKIVAAAKKYGGEATGSALTPIQMIAEGVPIEQILASVGQRDAADMRDSLHEFIANQVADQMMAVTYGEKDKTTGHTPAENSATAAEIDRVLDFTTEVVAGGTDGTLATALKPGGARASASTARFAPEDANGSATKIGPYTDTKQRASAKILTRMAEIYTSLTDMLRDANLQPSFSEVAPATYNAVRAFVKRGFSAAKSSTLFTEQTNLVLDVFADTEIDTRFAGGRNGQRAKLSVEAQQNMAAAYGIGRNAAGNTPPAVTNVLTDLLKTRSGDMLPVVLDTSPTHPNRPLMRIEHRGPTNRNGTQPVRTRGDSAQIVVSGEQLVRLNDMLQRNAQQGRRHMMKEVKQMWVDLATSVGVRAIIGERGENALKSYLLHGEPPNPSTRRELEALRVAADADPSVNTSTQRYRFMMSKLFDPSVAAANPRTDLTGTAKLAQSVGRLLADQNNLPLTGASPATVVELLAMATGGVRAHGTQFTHEMVKRVYPAEPAPRMNELTDRIIGNDIPTQDTENRRELIRNPSKYSQWMRAFGNERRPLFELARAFKSMGNRIPQARQLHVQINDMVNSLRSFRSDRDNGTRELRHQKLTRRYVKSLDDRIQTVMGFFDGKVSEAQARAYLDAYAVYRADAESSRRESLIHVKIDPATQEGKDTAIARLEIVERAQALIANSIANADKLAVQMLHVKRMHVELEDLAATSDSYKAALDDKANNAQPSPGSSLGTATLNAADLFRNQKQLMLDLARESGITQTEASMKDVFENADFDAQYNAISDSLRMSTLASGTLSPDVYALSLLTLPSLRVPNGTKNIGFESAAGAPRTLFRKAEDKKFTRVKNDKQVNNGQSDAARIAQQSPTTAIIEQTLVAYETRSSLRMHQQATNLVRDMISLAGLDNSVLEISESKPLYAIETDLDTGMQIVVRDDALVDSLEKMAAARAAKGSDAVFITYEDGNVVVNTLKDKALSEAFASEQNTTFAVPGTIDGTSRLLLNALQKTTTSLAALRTSLNPVFVLTRQIPRDFQESAEIVYRSRRRQPGGNVATNAVRNTVDYFKAYGFVAREAATQLAPTGYILSLREDRQRQVATQWMDEPAGSTKRLIATRYFNGSLISDAQTRGVDRNLTTKARREFAEIQRLQSEDKIANQTSTGDPAMDLLRDMVADDKRSVVKGMLENTTLLSSSLDNAMRGAVHKARYRDLVAENYSVDDAEILSQDAALTAMDPTRSGQGVRNLAPFVMFVRAFSAGMEAMLDHRIWKNDQPPVRFELDPSTRTFVRQPMSALEMINQLDKAYVARKASATAAITLVNGYMMANMLQTQMIGELEEEDLSDDEYLSRVEAIHTAYGGLQGAVEAYAENARGVGLQRALGNDLIADDIGSVHTVANQLGVESLINGAVRASMLAASSQFTKEEIALGYTGHMGTNLLPIGISDFDGVSFVSMLEGLLPPVAISTGATALGRRSIMGNEVVSRNNSTRPPSLSSELRAGDNGVAIDIIQDVPGLGEVLSDWHIREIENAFSQFSIVPGVELLEYFQDQTDSAVYGQSKNSLVDAFTSRVDTGPVSHEQNLYLKYTRADAETSHPVQTISVRMDEILKESARTGSMSKIDLDYVERAKLVKLDVNAAIIAVRQASKAHNAKYSAAYNGNIYDGATGRDQQILQAEAQRARLNYENTMLYANAVIEDSLIKHGFDDEVIPLPRNGRSKIVIDQWRRDGKLPRSRARVR